MLGTLDPRQKQQWSRHIGHLVHVYNCSLNEATGYSPYFLMFGRKARLPIDLSFGVSSDGTSTKSYQRFIKAMQQELKSAYELAEKKAGKKNAGNKKRYDQRLHYSHLVPGDRVLIRNLGLQGKHKLADRRSAEPYFVQSQMPNLPVFRLKPESGTGPIKILHRNHILPIGQELRQQVPHSVPKPTKRVLRRRKNVEKTQCPEQEVRDAPQEVGTRADPYAGSSDETYGVWFPEPEDCQLTLKRTETSQKDAVVSENDATENVEHFDVQDETPEETENVESIESCSRCLSENDSNNIQISQVSDLYDTVTSQVQDLVRVDQSDANQTIPDDVPETGRRSQRMRTVPKRFTYDTLGMPKVEPVLAHTKVVNPVRYCSTVYLQLNVYLSTCSVTLSPRQ
ncbi:hypothetical protein QQF64_009509 [Cirrhinus molitorella]|uniref:Uncharacterized protein n=1 Tax=Cirrhinus molitorella TaxID=172907 RepID=A0ABR3M1C8_9TELE